MLTAQQASQNASGYSDKDTADTLDEIYKRIEFRSKIGCYALSMSFNVSDSTLTNIKNRLRCNGYYVSTCFNNYLYISWA